MIFQQIIKRVLCRDTIIGFALGCICIYFLFMPLRKVNVEILKNREVSYSILVAQDSLTSRMDLADKQMDSLRHEIRNGRSNISSRLKKYLKQK